MPSKDWSTRRTRWRRRVRRSSHFRPKIPVFTVFKNGAILKNIFIVNKSPPPLSQLNLTPTVQTSKNPNQENEEILIVGRHPNCNILLTHPSISRFHLEILTDPSSQNLSVIDLQSSKSSYLLPIYLGLFVFPGFSFFQLSMS